MKDAKLLRPSGVPPLSSSYALLRKFSRTYRDNIYVHVFPVLDLSSHRIGGTNYESTYLHSTLSTLSLVCCWLMNYSFLRVATWKSEMNAICTHLLRDTSSFEGNICSCEKIVSVCVYISIIK